ncbi:unnamed protein product [Cuscuta europaea]|uniref:Uncharacterized protein n=1 Tax=Cuscuta europaea TaxID=41803 RepID=A0A9P0YSS5_CUSEU|nr:unnamed protein product [Cuscuta europaea]
MLILMLQILRARIRRQLCLQGLCEYVRRVEHMMEARGAVEEEAASLRKKLTEVEDSLRLATESMEERVRAAKAEGKSEGLAEAGEAAAEAARVAAEEAERAKAEEVAKAGKAAVEAFMTGG